MKRSFFLLAFYSVSIALIISMIVYGFAKEEINQAKRQTTLALAQGVAISVSSKLEQLNYFLDHIAQNPEIQKAVESGNQVRLKQALMPFQVLLPGAKQLRLLTPETAIIDQTEIPHLGFADLELVRAAFNKSQQPLVQGAKGPQRHLAIARRVELSDQKPAALLASMDYKFLAKVVHAANFKQGLLQLQQDDLVLASSGDLNLQTADDKNHINIRGSSWTLEYWYPEVSFFDQSYALIGTVLSLCLTLTLGFFVTFRKVTEIFQADQNSVLLAVKDMINGQMHGNYPVHLDETKTVIASMRQYKRIMEQQTEETELPTTDTELNLDDLFDEEPENPNLEIMRETDNQVAEFEIIDPETNQAMKVKATSKPVIIPDQDTEELVAVGVQEKQVNDLPSGFEIFRAYDIRGIVGESLSKDMLHNIGRALGSEVSERGRSTLVLARDGRNSSPMLMEALIQGVISTGTHVIDLGMVPTPVLYFVVHHHQDHCGAMLTGSHNPADYNGLKMVIEGETLAEERIQKLARRILENDYVSAADGNVTPNQLFRNEYIGAISDEVHLARPMKIVVDCGNGVAGEMAPILFRTLGCEVIELYCDIDGNFPNHHPDPSNPENLKDLQAAVKYYQADLGLAFDGDGDRLGVLDNQGKIIWPDRQMMLYAKDVLKQNPACDIIFDVKCTHLLAEQIVKAGGNPIMYKTGHSFMKAKIKETQAKLAGEMSGHIFFNDRWFGFDDALYTGSRLIEILSADSQSSQEVFAGFPDSVNTPEINVKVDEGENHPLVEKLIAGADFETGTISTIDGLRVDFSDGWGLVRASNTTPALVMRFDADNQDALNRIQEQFKTLLLSIQPDLVLPF